MSIVGVHESYATKAKFQGLLSLSESMRFVLVSNREQVVWAPRTNKSVKGVSGNVTYVSFVCTMSPLLDSISPTLIEIKNAISKYTPPSLPASVPSFPCPLFSSLPHVALLELRRWS